VLLKADANSPNRTDEAAADVFGCHLNTVANIRQHLQSAVWKQRWHAKGARISLA
jgi:hypothetical protein